MRPAVACLIAVLALIGAGGSAPADQPPGDRDLTVANHGAKAINELYVSPASADHWGADRLGDDTLAPGRTLRLKLGRVRDCEFDVQAVYEDASREETKGVNVCRAHMIAFDGSAATAPLAATHEVTLANRAARPIQQVLISPSDAGDWGEDRLGEKSISVGEAASVRYRGDCVADIRVVFDNRGAEERRGVDLCARRRIVIQPGWTTADTVPTEADPGTEAVQLVVSNRSGRKVAGLFVFPDMGSGPVGRARAGGGRADDATRDDGAGDGASGPDLLGNAGLADGASVTIAFSRPAGVCRFDARVVFAAKPSAQMLDGLDLCHSADLVLPGTL